MYKRQEFDLLVYHNGQFNDVKFTDGSGSLAAPVAFYYNKSLVESVMRVPEGRRGIVESVGKVIMIAKSRSNVSM